MAKDGAFRTHGGIQYAPWQRGNTDWEKIGAKGLRMQPATVEVEDRVITVSARNGQGSVRFTRDNLDGIFYLGGIPLLTGTAVRFRSGDETATFWGGRMRRLRKELEKRGWEVRIRHL